MKLILIALALILVTSLLCLACWRLSDKKTDRSHASHLISTQAATPGTFHKSMIDQLPLPARRFFTFAIAEGTSLHTVADITMTGSFGMGNASAPNYLTMQATQILAAPQGFIWAMHAKSGRMLISGSDSENWTRFWLSNLLPVARAGGTADHARSAFARVVAEAAIWTPAALLPSDTVRWAAVNDTTARVTVTHDTLTQSVDLTVDSDGKLQQISMMRWSDANPDKTFQLQPFGGTVSHFKTFEGFTLPTHVEAGNHFGTDDYFAFFIANVTSLTFPSP